MHIMHTQSAGRYLIYTKSKTIHFCNYAMGKLAKGIALDLCSKCGCEC